MSKDLPADFVKSDEPLPSVPEGATDGLKAYWGKQVHELAKVHVGEITPEWAERHRIYSLLTMALIYNYWNGNKSGADGEYPWRSSQKISDGRYRGDRQFGDRYIGHNIACIAVDENGEVIDFDFNHNDLFNSSAEHAEARLIRRIFSLTQIFDHWQTEAEGERKRVKYDAMFNGTTIYTSLESCAQCSGIMTLANAKQVVYLQSDLGQYLVGNIVYNLTRPTETTFFLKGASEDYTRPGQAPQKYFAPEPIDASLFGFEYKQRLDEGYKKFAKECKPKSGTPFFIGPNPGDQPVHTAGITSFLCTDIALEIYGTAAKELGTMTAKFPDFSPDRSDGKKAYYTNAKALEHVRMFLAHAINQGHRGTTHR